MLWCYSALVALVLMCCDYYPEGRGTHRKANVRVEIDTLWGWHCDDRFYYAKSRPGEYPEVRPPAPPVLGQVIERDTVILFIATNCPFYGAANLEKYSKSP